ARRDVLVDHELGNRQVVLAVALVLELERDALAGRAFQHRRLEVVVVELHLDLALAGDVLRAMVVGGDVADGRGAALARLVVTAPAARHEHDRGDPENDRRRGPGPTRHPGHYGPASRAVFTGLGLPRVSLPGGEEGRRGRVRT